MRNNILAAIIAAAAGFAVLPATAADWTSNINACTAAAEEQGVVSAGAYSSKVVSVGGASVKTILIELSPDGGDAVKATCKIRRGKVSEFTVQA
ncbi:hypothetical protein [Hyphococcus sp.]|uniref:hypothetical protein n=1 Tax=Hyphococcus sp. TaxID=2038636 RepID=UPI002082016A|nr:MAG: hypothetical protein DHS20C04_29790 [Marinicaulis sp.]